jgi:hypothetical protein
MGTNWKSPEWTKCVSIFSLLRALLTLLEVHRRHHHERAGSVALGSPAANPEDPDRCHVAAFGRQWSPSCGSRWHLYSRAKPSSRVRRHPHPPRCVPLFSLILAAHTLSVSDDTHGSLRHHGTSSFPSLTTPADTRSAFATPSATSSARAYPSDRSHHRAGTSFHSSCRLARTYSRFQVPASGWHLCRILWAAAIKLIVSTVSTIRAWRARS